MTTQVGSAVAMYGAYSRLGAVDHGAGLESLDRYTTWDSLGRHSTISGKQLGYTSTSSVGFCYVYITTH